MLQSVTTLIDVISLFYLCGFTYAYSSCLLSRKKFLDMQLNILWLQHCYVSTAVTAEMVAAVDVAVVLQE